MSDTPDLLAKPSENTTLPAPDASLLRTLTPADLKHFPALHLSHYEKGNKHLLYVGTKHANDVETRSHDIILQSVTKHKPEIMIVEGVETDRGLSPPLGFDLKNPADRERFFTQGGESTHAAELARARKIPFIGGEASPRDVFTALEKAGHSTKENMALYLVRHIPVWKRSGILKHKEQLPQMAASFFANSPAFNHIPKEQRLTYEEFNSIYNAHKAEMGNKEAFDLTAPDSNPGTKAQNTYFQSMSEVMDRVRDEHLLNLISATLDKHDKVMVVYGNAHQYMSAPVFERMFDAKPHIETLSLTELPTPQPAPAAPLKTSPASSVLDSRRAPSTTSNWLKYSSFALIGAAVTALSFGTAPLVAGALLLGSAAAYTGSKLGEAAAQPIPAPVYETAPAPQKAAQESAIASGQQPEKSTTENKDMPKSWVAKSAAAEAAQPTRSV